MVRQDYTKGEWRRFVGVYQRQDLHEVVVADGSELVAYTNTEANANLIAAAPDMYEACQNVYEAHRAGLPRLMESVIETMVRPALSKAKGDK